MHMGAVVKFTCAQIRYELRHGVLNLRYRELRHAELLEPRGVNNLAGLSVQITIEQTREGRGVFATVEYAGNLACAQICIGYQGVNQ